MEYDKVAHALDDVALIKDIIGKTAVSFAACSRIFLYWGILALLIAVPSVFIFRGPLHDPSPFRLFLLTFFSMYSAPILLIGGYIIHQSLTHGIRLTGLSRELLNFWVWSVLLLFLPFVAMLAAGLLEFYGVLPRRTDAPTDYRVMSNPFIPIFVLAISLLATGIIARMNALKWLALTYGVGGFLWLVIRPSVGIGNSYADMFALTFLLLGSYLEWMRRRGAYATD